MHNARRQSALELAEPCASSNAAATAVQVRNTAATFLVPDRLQLIVVGDKKIVEQQLAPFGKIVP